MPCSVLGGDQNVGQEAISILARGRERAPALAGSPTETPRSRSARRRANALLTRSAARVAKLRAQQAGFGEVWLTDEGADPVLGVLPRASRRWSGTATASRSRTTAVSSPLGGPAAGLPDRRARLGGAVPSRRRGATGARLVRETTGRAPPAAARRARTRARGEDRRLAPARPRALPAFLDAGGPQPTRRRAPWKPARASSAATSRRRPSGARTRAGAARTARARAAAGSSPASRPMPPAAGEPTRSARGLSCRDRGERAGPPAAAGRSRSCPAGSTRAAAARARRRAPGHR